MIEGVRKRLEEFEALVKTKKIERFQIGIGPDGILVTTEDEEHRTLVPLSEEHLQSLQMFFYDVESIEYGSPDYNSLTSIIHAKATLERILRNPQYQ